jgi:hypothetical protein
MRKRFCKLRQALHCRSSTRTLSCRNYQDTMPVAAAPVLPELGHRADKR